MSKVSKIVLWVLSFISVVLAAMYFFGGTVSTLGYDDVPKFYDTNLYWSVILFIITVLITFGFAIEFIITHPKSLKGAAIAIVSAIALIGISYALASSDPIPNARVEAVVDATPLTLKWVGVGIIATYILGGIALLTMIVSEIYRAFR